MLLKDLKLQACLFKKKSKGLRTWIEMWFAKTVENFTYLS